MNCTEMTQKLKIAMPKSTCSQHYRILREAGLIVSERRGVDLSSRVRVAELEARFPGLLASILKSYKKETSRQARGPRPRGLRDQNSITRGPEPSNDVSPRDPLAPPPRWR